VSPALVAVRAFDAVIAGAGPAGAVAARDLARAGARVAVVDGSHPREKPCGGGVTARALALLGSDSRRQSAEATRIERITFETAGRAATVLLPSADYLRVFDRASFDTALLRDAVAAGAELIPARIGTMERRADRWQLSAGTAVLESPWLIGADGAGGVVRKRVFRPFDRTQLSIAAGSYVDGVDTADIVIAFIDRPSGYLWSFPRPGHLAVGTCAQASETSTAEMHAITDAWLERYPLAAGRPRRRYAWPIPSLTPAGVDAERPAGEGWMLLVDPITREGIFFAIRSGLLAAEAMRTANPAAAYAARVRDELHDELRRAARFKVGFYRPRFLGSLIDALNRSAAIRDVMIDLVAGRQTYRGLKRRLLGTMELGVMLRVLRSSG
jgi:flavin-dependent dehydrogenase